MLLQGSSDEARLQGVKANVKAIQAVIEKAKLKVPSLVAVLCFVCTVLGLCSVVCTLMLLYAVLLCWLLITVCICVYVCVCVCTC